MSLADELTKLEELRRGGALTDAEFAQAKAALLAGPAPAADPPLAEHLADQLAEVRYQNELARLDREWEMERQQYLIPDRYGRRHVPTTGMGVVGAVVGAVVGGAFGLFWTILTASIASSAPDFGAFAVARSIFPLFGVLFTAAAVGYGLYAYARAQKYDLAYRAYRARREKVRPEQFQGA